MSTETSTRQQAGNHPSVVAAGGMVALDAAAQAEYVTQQMMALAENIETLLQALEATQLHTRHLRERWNLARQQLGRSQPVKQPGMTQADFDRTLIAWHERIGQVRRDLLAEESLLRGQMQRCREQLLQARRELKALQDDALPAAQRQDAQQRVTHLEQEQHALERELDALHAELSAHELNKHALDTVQTRYTNKLGRVEASAAQGSAANSNDDNLARSVSELSQDQREQLAPIVQLVGGVLQSQRGGPRGSSKLAGSTVPINAATAVLQSRWGEHISKMNVDGWMDVNQLIQWVMREAYINNTEDLRGYAYRVKYFTDLKRTIREELVKARSFQREHQVIDNGQVTLKEPYQKQKFNTVPEVDPSSGALTVRKPDPGDTTQDPRGLDEYIKELEQLLNTVGDDAQLAQVDLQNVTQKQQQTLQTLSNMSKVLHETSMAIIRKIGS